MTNAETVHTAAVIEVGGEHQASCSCGWYGNRYSSLGPAQVQARRHLSASPQRANRCCDLHGRNCEPVDELCCSECTEAAHPQHRDGSMCSNPDLSTSPGQTP